MANSLDLQEQEQLDELKAFWKQYGNLITWVLIAVFGAAAAWNGWTLWQRDQGAKAAAMADALDEAVQAGDAARAARVFADLKERFPRTVVAAQAGLTAARLQYDKQDFDGALASLAWVRDQAGEAALGDVARLRAAGILIERKQAAAALKELEGATGKAMAALVADRRGDALLAAGRRDEARQAYQAAWAALERDSDYRNFLAPKLVALAAPPAVEAASGAAR